MVHELMLFTDKKAINRLEAINFDRVKGGETSTKKIYIKNMSGDWPIVDIKIVNTDREVSFKTPERLEPGEVGEVTVSWKPKNSRRKKLDDGFQVIGSLEVG